ncbi:MAG: DUF6642 family protein [Pseudomonadota bacterium]
MARMKRYDKNIVCLESLWNTDIEQHWSVAPILQMACSINNIKFIHMTCNTKAELRHNLRRIKGRSTYGIVYLAFHGKPGVILLDGDSVSLESLAMYMEGGFRDRVIHFGSCSTIDVEKARVRRFIEATGVAMVLGHRRDVNWIEGTALDLLIMDRLQYYKDMRKFWKSFRARYRNLVPATGLRAFHR